MSSEQSQLKATLSVEMEKLKEIDKGRNQVLRVIRKLRDKINTITTADALGDGELTIENIMKLDWNQLPTKVYERVTTWFYKNLKYLHQSGYHPDNGGQPAFYIKMDRGAHLEEQIEEISKIVDLTNWYPADCKYFRLSSSSRDPKKDCKFKPFSLFVTASVHQDDTSSYSLRVFEDESVAIACNGWRQDTFASLDDALGFVHKNMYYNDSERD